MKIFIINHLIYLIDRKTGKVLEKTTDWFLIQETMKKEIEKRNYARRIRNIK